MKTTSNAKTNPSKDIGIAKGNLIAKDMTGFKSQQDANVPLKNMDNQLLEMDRDYNVMLMERIESKKQQEAKF